MERSAASVVLKTGRGKPIRNRHPWVFSGAIDAVSGEPNPGQVVDVVSAENRWLARGYYNPRSQIVVRVLTWNEDEQVDNDFWERRIGDSVARRQLLKIGPDSTAYRLVNAESDGLPGLIVDRYDDYLVLQVQTLGVAARLPQIVDVLSKRLRPAGILERSDLQVRRKEGLPSLVKWHHGKAPGNGLFIQENGVKIGVDLDYGHKTGLYLDQRENHTLVCSPRNVTGRTVLNLFSYTGGFGLHAAAAGADSITNVDSSRPALELLEANMERNELRRAQDESICGDAFQILRQMRDEGRRFDTIVVDPPKFAHSRSEVDAACRGYKDLNMLALQLTGNNGLLATFSCSGRVSRDLFQKVLFSAAIDAQRDMQIIQSYSQPADHPILITFPESAYLKGFLCRVF